MLRRLPRAVGFAGWYAVALLAANVRVAREVVTPGLGIAPGIARVPMRSRTGLEVTSLAALVNLTPGTLVVEVREKEHVMFVHGLHAGDEEAFVASVLDTERRLLQVLR